MSVVLGGLLSGCSVVITLAAGATLAGISPPTPSRNVVIAKLDAMGARIRAADYDLTVGDGVRVLRHYCSRDRTGTAVLNCFDDPVSEGSVIATVGPHILDVRFPTGSDFDVGDHIVPVRPEAKSPPTKSN